VRTATPRKDPRSRTTSTTGTPTALHRLPTPAQLNLPVVPTTDRRRATVTAAALRATISEWLDDAEESAPRTVEGLATVAHVPLATVRDLMRRGATTPVSSGTAARLLWSMGEPLRPDLRQALADDLVDEAARKAARSGARTESRSVAA